MENLTISVENGCGIDKILDWIIDTFACFVEREFVELDYSQVSITARAEDMPYIENALAPLV